MKNLNNAEKRLARRARPVTLVEVLMACVVLAALVVAGAAFVYQSLGAAAVQKHRRLALAAASSRLEQVCASPYGEVAPPTLDYGVYYLSGGLGAWVHSTTDPGETVPVGGENRPQVTTVQFRDLDGAATSYDCVTVRVRVQYGVSARDVVLLETVRAP